MHHDTCFRHVCCVSVSTDDTKPDGKRHDTGLQEQGVTFPLLSDKDGAVAEAYQSSLKIPFLGTFAKR